VCVGAPEGFGRAYRPFCEEFGKKRIGLIAGVLLVVVAG